MHRTCEGSPRTAKLIKLGHKSWSKIKESGKLWCNVDVDCPESELAWQRLEDWECEEFPTDGGYHQLCYNAFCNTTNIQRKIAHHGSRSADDASAREARKLVTVLRFPVRCSKRWRNSSVVCMV